MVDLHLEEVVELGKDSGRGNIVGIEPYISAADYMSAQTLLSKLDGYMSEAKQGGWLNKKTIVLLPETLGTWLVLANEPESVFRTDKLAVAEQRLVLHHIFSFLLQFIVAKEKGRMEAAVFRLKAKVMADSYNELLSTIAKNYGVTVVGGSTFLPAPQILDGKLVAGEGPLFSVTPVYGPDGRAYSDLVLKAYPTMDELPFIKPASPKTFPAFDTPAGKLGVLICADAWFPDSYERLKELNVEIIAMPSNDGNPALWDQVWGGYSGWPMPSDVDANDVKKLTEGEAWHKYTLAGRIGVTPARAGSNIFLRGQLFDMKVGAGETTIIKDGDVLRHKKVTGASLVNLCL